jgi:hypothetical protein
MDETEHRLVTVGVGRHPPGGSAVVCILSAHGVEDALEARSYAGRRRKETLREAYSSSSRMVSTASQAFPSVEEAYRIKQREHSFLDPCQSGDETWLILGISDDLKDALSVAVRSLLHHFDAGSAIRFMLCLRNLLEASPTRFIQNTRLWDIATIQIPTICEIVGGAKGELVHNALIESWIPSQQTLLVMCRQWPARAWKLGPWSRITGRYLRN